jgi:hypothetical protein
MTNKDLVADLETAMSARKDSMVRGIVEVMDMGGTRETIARRLTATLDKAFVAECLKEAGKFRAARDAAGG